MKNFTLKSSLLSLTLLSGCGNFHPPTISDAPSSDSVDLPEAIGEVAQPLDQQGFFEARGYYTNNDTVAGDCLVAADGGKIVPVQPPNAGGQEVTFSLSLLESSKDLSDRMSIDASAKAKFLVGGGEMKVNFATQTQFAETRTTLLAKVTVKNTSWTVPPGIKFRADVEPLLKGVAGAAPTDAQLVRFRNRCGDGFLHSYTTGGEYFALIQVDTQSKSESESIKAHIAGNYLTYSASADFEKELSKIVSNSKTVVRTYQVGGEGPTASPCSDVACVSKRIDEFTQAVTNKPVVFATEVKPYTILKMPQDGVKPIDITTAKDQMALINRERDSTQDLISRFIDVLAYPDTYALGTTTLASISTALDTANANFTTLNSALRNCGRTPTGCKMPTLKTISTTVPPTKPIPARVVLRSYDKPSSFLLDAGQLTSCDNPFLRIGGVDDHGGLEAATFNIVPGLNAAARAFSLQSLLQQTHVTVRLDSPCSKRVKLTVPRTDDEKNRASFYRERGLNGKPNTWSFRLYGNPAGETLYLTRSKVTPISVTAQPAVTVDPVALEAFRNSASWYVEQP